MYHIQYNTSEGNKNQKMLFQSLSATEKIDFFLKCQSLLMTHHPNSPFLFREDNIQERLYAFKQLTQKYKGFVYSSEKVCLLYNKIMLEDPNNPARAVRNNMYKESAEKFNCCIIDFVVFDQLESVKQFIETEYSEEIEYLIWVKNSEIKLYKTKNLIGNLGRLVKF